MIPGMQGQPMQGPPVPMGMQGPSPSARQAAIEMALRRGGMPMTNPVGMAKDGGNIFVNRDLLPPSAGKGKKVWILAKVENLGSKAELQPISAQVCGIEAEGPGDDDENSAVASPSQNGED